MPKFMKLNTLKLCQQELENHRKKVAIRSQNLLLVSSHLVNYFNENREKRIALILVILFPVSCNIYLLAPDTPYPYYYEFSSFVFTLSESFGHILAYATCYFLIPKKDKIFQYLPFFPLGFAIYQFIAKLNISDVPVYLEIVSCVAFTLSILLLMYQIKKISISDKVHKVNHGLLQPISRIKGLGNLDLPYNDYKNFTNKENDALLKWAKNYLEGYHDPEPELDDFLIK